MRCHTLQSMHRGALGTPTGTVIHRATPASWHTRAWQPNRLVAAQAQAQAATDKRVADAVADVLRQVPPSRRAPLAEVQAPLDGIKQLGKDLQLNRVEPKHIPGCFNMELTTDQNAFTGDVTNMARFTFGQIGPPGLEVDLALGPTEGARRETGLPNLYRGPYDGIQNGYVLFTHFRVVEPDADPAVPSLIGVLAAVAEYGVVDGTDGQPSTSMSVAFRKLKLWPVPSVQGDAGQLARWLKILQPANPNMDGNGCVEVVLPANGPVGMISYLLMAPDLQVHVGNAGSHMILSRTTPPAGTLGAQLGA